MDAIIWHIIFIALLPPFIIGLGWLSASLLTDFIIVLDDLKTYRKEHNKNENRNKRKN